MKTSTPTFILLLAAVGMLGGCSRQEQPAATGRITGAIHYHTPVTFEAETVLELRLTDVSVSDGPALEVARLTVENLDVLPYRYTLPYDATRIDARHRYTVDARIFSGGRLRFSTDTAYGVLTQGHDNQRDIALIATGGNNPAPSAEAGGDTSIDIFHNELRTGQEISLYQASLQDGRLLWLEEDRSHGAPQPLHARYEFKGALIMRYVDTSPMEISFDERGRPTGIVKNRKTLKLDEHTANINAIRNRAELLRSHALATRAIRAHRQATGG